MNETETPLTPLFKAFLVLLVEHVIIFAWFIWFVDYTSNKAYQRGLNEVPASMQRVIEATKQSDSLTIDYFNRNSTKQEKSIARGLLVYLKSVKELERKND